MRRHPEAHRRPCKRGVPGPRYTAAACSGSMQKQPPSGPVWAGRQLFFVRLGRACGRGNPKFRAEGSAGAHMRFQARECGGGLCAQPRRNGSGSSSLDIKKLPRLFESPKDPIYAAAADRCVVRSAHANGYALRAGCIYGSISISVSKYRSWKATWAAISAAVKVAPAGATTHLSSTSFFRWMTATFSPVKDETGSATPST